MRASKNASSDEIRERYLGEIAPLLDAAKPIDSLSEVQKKQVRKRIVRTLFRTRFLSSRVRLVPVLAALGMVVIGGAAFATAERLGFISKLGAKKASAPAGQPKQEVRKRRGTGGHGAGSPEGSAVEVDLAEAESDSAESDSVVLPEVPDPLLSAMAKARKVGWSMLSETRKPAVAVPGVAASVARAAMTSTEVPIKTLRRPMRLAAFAAPAPVMTAPAPVMSAPTPVYVGQAPSLDTPAPLRPVSIQVQPVRPSALGAPAMPAEVDPFQPVAQAAVPAPAARTAVVPKAVALSALAPRAYPSDQALFGQAMRKLRVDSDPSAALSALQEHARAYPRSSLSGERGALEVEALLALHRDRDALARLDTMALDELPRSGERFVVRGELRAAARRWLEASADFDRALAGVSGSPAWHERALWGRGAARLRCGEREAGMADLERYLDKYPSGRFATAAAKFFPGR
jgi:hypothetical protein